MSSPAHEAPAKPSRGKWALLLTAVFLLVLFIDVRLFLRSTFLTEKVEGHLAAKSGDEYFIGGLEVTGWKEFRARDVHLSLARGDRVFVPEVRVRLSRGRQVRVEEVDLVSPVVLLGGGGSGIGAGGEAPSFPLERLTVREARVVVESRYARSVGPLDIVLAQVGGGMLRLQGSVALPLLPLPVRVDLVFDPSDIRGAAGSAALRDLKLSSPGFGLPFAGSMDVDLALAKEAERQVLTAEGRIRDFSYGGFMAGPVFDAPFRLQAGFSAEGRIDAGGRVAFISRSPSDERHDLTFNLLVGAGLKTVEKSKVTLESPHFGSWTAAGTASVGKDGPRLDVRADFSRINLATLRSSAPLPGLEKLPLTGGVLSGGISLHRPPGEDLLMDGALTVSSPVLSGGHPLSGWLPAVTGSDFRMRLKGPRGPLEIEELKTNAVAGLPLSLRGTVTYGGAGQRPQVDLRAALPWLPAGQIAGLLEKQGASLMLPTEAGGEAMASLHLEGSAAAPVWWGEVLLRDGNLDEDSIGFRDLSGRAAFSGSGGSLLADKVQLHAEEARTRAGQTRVSAGDVSLYLSDIEFDGGESRGVKADIHAASSRLRIEMPGRDIPALEDLSLSLAGVLDGSLSSFSWKGLEVKGLPGSGISGEGAVRWSHLLEAETYWVISFAKESLDFAYPLLWPPGPPPDMEGSGTVSVSASLLPLISGGREVRLKGGLRVNDAGFASADKGRAVGGLNFSGSAEAVLTYPSGTGTWSAEVRTESFEALAGPYYLDFTNAPVTAAGSGSLDLPGRSVRAGDFSLSLEEVLSFRWQRVPGRGGRPSERAALSVEDAGRAYDLLIRDNFSETSPFLAGLEIEGTASVAADLLRNGGSPAARGLLEVDVGSAGHRNGSFSLDGGHLTLPFDFPGSGEKPAGFAEEPGSFGTLFIDALRIGPILAEAIAAKPAVHKGSLLFDGTLTLPLFGTSIALESPRWENLVSPERSLSLAADVRGLDIGKVFEAFSLPPVRGTASGRFDRLLLEGGTLEADGRLDVSFFGGTLTFTEFGGKNLTGPVPSWGFSLVASDIDLEQLTKTFDFGKISGVAGGYARDVVIAAGQLQHFDAGFETDRRRGVEQKISVEALEKISILGSGGRPDVFSRGIMQFFKEYNYAKIGFTATLRNDNLSLDGIGGDGERTYLVKGGILPPKANVISHSREISFGEIVERLARIGRVGSEGPQEPN